MGIGRKFELAEEELKKVSGGDGCPGEHDIIACPACGFEDEAWSWYSGPGDCPNCGNQVID